MIYFPRYVFVLAFVAAIAATFVFQTIHKDAEVCALANINAIGKRPKAFPKSRSLKDATLTRLDLLEKRCTAFVRQTERKCFYLDALMTQVLDFSSQHAEIMFSVDRNLAGLHQFEKNLDGGSLGVEGAKYLESQKVRYILGRQASRTCFVRLVTAARRLMATPEMLEQGSGCTHNMLTNAETAAVRGAEAEEEDAGAQAYLGAYWSELATAGRSAAPLLGTGAMLPEGAKSGWVRDSWGTTAPADMVHAEMVLARSEQIPGFKRPVLSLLHARRLEEHAKLLEAQGQHDAAAMRYRAMAKVSEAAGNSAVAAHALSKLSHSLKSHGSHEDAILAAKDAVSLTMDPLAQFVLASARLSAGLLNTDASIKAAELQLRAVAGRLPTDELEFQRATMHSEMMMWRWISRGDISKCRVLKDVAKFLICVIAKKIF